MRAPLLLVAALALVPTAGAALALPAIPAAAPAGASYDVAGLNVYPTWPLLTLELQDLAARYPDILRLHSAGTSSKGLDLWVVEVADFENPDRVPLEQREVLWVDGGTHANEHSGVLFVEHLLRWLAEGYGENETATWIVDHRRTFIMPLLNPDGSVATPMGRLNGNLVNINRNYPVGWGDLDESPIANNPGPYPASEPETRAVVAFWQAIRPDYMASVHCCGNLWLYPYGIEGRDPHPDDRPLLRRVCDEAFAPVREDCGPIWSTIYPASGSSVDTAYEYTGAVAFGFEMSGREGNLPFTQAPVEETESESWAGLLHAFRNVERYGAYPEVRVVGVGPGEARLEVRNGGWANLTRGTLSLADARNTVQQAALPRLEPGQAAELRVPGVYGPGSFPLELRWQRRALGGEGVLGHVLGVVQGAGGLVGSLDGLVPTASPAATPGAEAAAALGALGLAALALRARRP